MKTLYLDCFSGLSGNMFLGALIDLGFKPSTLEWELGKLDLPDAFHLHVQKVQRMAVTAVHFEVHEGKTHGAHCETHDHGHDHSHDHPHDHGDGKKTCGCGHDHDHSHAHDHDHGHDHHDHSHGHSHPHGARDYAAIRTLISASTLSETVKSRALAVFHRIAVAEAKIHGTTVDQVHFHEVGAIDSIVDILGACIALENLGIEQVLASPLVEGTGTIRCAHGTYPLPAPATLEILAGIPLTQQPVPHELITPTGAALLAEFVAAFGPLHDFAVEKIGYGAGTRTLADRPNVVRALLGRTASEGRLAGAERDRIVQIETNIDDCTAEELGHTFQLLLDAGALDVAYSPLQMKKNRPGWLLTVLAEPGLLDRLAEIILRETSAFGLRYQTWDRIKLRRESTTVQTPHGGVRVKTGYLGDTPVKTTPEFEDCRRVAAEKNIPLAAVYRAVQAALIDK